MSTKEVVVKVPLTLSARNKIDAQLSKDSNGNVRPNVAQRSDVVHKLFFYREHEDRLLNTVAVLNEDLFDANMHITKLEREVTQLKLPLDSNLVTATKYLLLITIGAASAIGICSYLGFLVL